jgi:hypothetical protein
MFNAGIDDHAYALFDLIQRSIDPRGVVVSFIQ